MKKKYDYQRRSFVKSTVLGTASIAILGCSTGSSDQSSASADSLKSAIEPPMPETIHQEIGLQLWTVKDDLAKDVKGTLSEVSKAGYRNVEVFGWSEDGFFGLKVPEFKTILEGEGLSPVSGHHLLSRFKDWDPKTKTFSKKYMQGLEAAKTLGQEYTVVPWMMEEERQEEDDPKKFAEVLNYAAEEASKMDLKFGYHNHDFEFKKYGGQTMYDIFLKETDADKVKMEMDVYWVVYAGHDPIPLVKENPGRFPLYHIKDLNDSEKRESTELGSGIIDFKSLLSLNEVAGAKHLIVEQEEFLNMPALKSIAVDYKVLKSLI